MNKKPLLALSASLFSLLCTFAHGTGDTPAADVSRTAASTTVLSGDAKPPANPLDQELSNYRGEDEDIQSALQLIGRTYNITIVSDPEVTGKTTFQIPKGTVRDALDSICEPNGYYYEQSRQNGRYIYVKKNKTVLYTVEYPQLQRNSTENSSVTLSGGNASPSSSGYNATTPESSGSTSSMGDQTSIQISSKNEGDFWAGVNEEIKGMLHPGETYFINKFTGIVSVKASPRRHAEEIDPFITLLNRIINQEVYIDAQILEVTFNDQNKLGVDWNQAATTIDRSVNVQSASSATNMLTVGSATLPGNTFSAVLGSGKLTALINALQEQGNVKSKSNPKISTLNNQTAVIAVGTEQTFYSVDTSFSQTTASSTAYSSTTDRYVKDKYTFGVVLKATPYVRRDGSITIDLLPSITKLVGTQLSPDKKQTSPNVDQKRISTIVRLHPGESAIIGGMITESDGKQTNRVPFLGSIPVLGHIFRTEATVKGRSEIVIILTASTSKPAAASSALFQVDAGLPVLK